MRRPPEELASKLASVAEQFVTSGPRLRVDDVAAAAGIPRATLYYYFAGKDELLAFLVSQELAGLAEDVAAAAGGGGPVAARLEHALAAVVAVCAPRPQMCLHLLTQVAGNDALRPLLVGAPGTPLAPVRELLREGQANGEIVAADPDLAVAAMVGAVLVACVSDPAGTGSTPAAPGRYVVRGLLARP